jgi:hypothetical protein
VTESHCLATSLSTDNDTIGRSANLSGRLFAPASSAGIIGTSSWRVGQMLDSAICQLPTDRLVAVRAPVE